MMQRSDLVLATVGLGGSAAAFALGGALPAAVIGLGVLTGMTLGSVVRPGRGKARAVNAAKAAKATKVVRGARSAAAAVSAVSLVPARAVRPVRTASLPMEAGSARMAPPELRLTGDILHGMQTGGKTTRGLCSACGATLWLSARRPLKATCPMCGHTRVLER
jgi:DNA-directed RNA polymerase subunit RPC12/RpoP